MRAFRTAPSSISRILTVTIDDAVCRFVCRPCDFVSRSSCLVHTREVLENAGRFRLCLRMDAKFCALPLVPEFQVRIRKISSPRVRCMEDQSITMGKRELSTSQGLFPDRAHLMHLTPYPGFPMHRNLSVVGNLRTNNCSLSLVPSFFSEGDRVFLH